MAQRRRREDRYVRGIFNYCDRWCEHCPATARCRVFDGVKDHTECGEVWDGEFWGKFRPVFERTMAMLYESAGGAAAQEPPSVPWSESNDEEDDLLQDEAARAHPCSVAARAYAEEALRWLKEASAECAVKDAELSAQPSTDRAGDDPEANATAIRAVLDIIQWHQDQISVKLLRALSHPEMGDPDGPCPKDSDGSAKVALIGVERSIAACGELLEYIPHHEQELLSLLSQLYRLRQGIESTFPRARAFVRPWFDEQKA